MNKNNNPLNIKNDKKRPWKGTYGTDKRGHGMFDDPSYGIRAAMRSLELKWCNGKTTIRAIINDWAPATDTIGSIAGNENNNPLEYANYCSEMIDYPIDKKLPSPREETGIWAKLILAMSHYEMGYACDPAIIEKGIAHWVEDFT